MPIRGLDMKESVKAGIGKRKIPRKCNIFGIEGSDVFVARAPDP
jgi:hypothetical protein